MHCNAAFRRERACSGTITQIRDSTVSVLPRPLCTESRPPRLRESPLEISERPLAPDQRRRTPRLHRATRSRSCDQSLLLFELWRSCRSRDGDEGHDGFLDADAAMCNSPFSLANESAERRSYQREVVVRQSDVWPNDRSRVISGDIGSQYSV